MSRKIDSLSLSIDKEMWYSVTPEMIAKRHARVCKGAVYQGLLLDAFCGLAGDLLYQANGLFCIGCDIVEERLHDAQCLLAQMECKSRVDLVLTDSVRGRSCFRAHAFDIVYLSPPWGHEGIINRKKSPVFGSRRLNQLLVNGREAFMRALSLANSECNIAFYLPRGMSESDIHFLASMTNQPALVDVHEAFDPDDETVEDWNKYKVRAITVYFGKLAQVSIS